MTTRTAVYKHFHEGTLQYVGVTSDPARRLGQHIQAGKWLIDEVSLTWFASRAEAEQVERDLIRKFAPVQNDMLKRRDLTAAKFSPKRGETQTTPMRWKELADAGMTSEEAAAVEGKTPAAARKAASVHGFKFARQRRREAHA